MPAVVLFKGPFHVMEYADEEAIAFSGRDGRGMPVREVFPEERWAPIQAAMDEAYRSGAIIRLDRPLGTVILGPRFDARGRVCGVATWFQLSHRPAVALHPTSQPVPQLLEDRAG